jgi:RHS repeat-associated protein
MRQITAKAIEPPMARIYTDKKDKDRRKRGCSVPVPHPCPSVKSVVEFGFPLGVAVKWLANSPLVGQIVYATNGITRMTTSKTFDDLNRLTGISSAPSGARLLPSGSIRFHDRFNYAYDAAGNLLTRQRPPIGNNKVAYTLNSLNQITNSLLGGQGIYGWTPEITVSGSTTTPANTVTVNGQAGTLFADNSFAQSGFVVTNGLNSFTAMAANTQGLCSTNTSVVTVNITNSGYAYDLNGNLLTDGTRCFAYDDENELISVWATNVWRNDFVYDGKLRRRIERDFTWLGGAWAQTNEIHFIYDGNLVVQERNTNNQPVVEYTRGKDLSGSFQGAGGIGGLLARSQDSLPPTPFYMAHSYYHADGNGNVTMLINASQTMAAKYLYDAFGNTLAQSGYLAAANTYRFSSKEWNANSGLYYYLYRFYDPNLQRWPNRDPLGEPGFEVLRSGRLDLLGDGPNLYVFVKDNPVNQTDPLGLDGEATFGMDPTLLMDEEELAAYRAQCAKCALLRAAVVAAKAGVGALGGVKSGDSCAVLKAKTAAWLALAVARTKENQICFGGGNPTHQEEAAKAWKQVGEGISLQTEKGCVGSPTGGGGER